VPPLGYHKYALPELAQTDPPAPTNKENPDALTWPPSEEAEWEVRPLKVGNTLLAASTPSPAAPAIQAVAKLPEPPASAPPPPAEFEDEPVYIPTTGLPPAVIGFMVVGSLLLVAALGFFVLW
jgi:hypothetical protein